MKSGVYLSGTAHLLLIGWVLFNGTFESRSEPPVVQSVTVLSVDQFQNLFTDETTNDGETAPPPVTAAILPKLSTRDLSSTIEPEIVPSLPTEQDNPIRQAVPQIAPQPLEPFENDLVIDTETVVPPILTPEESPQSDASEQVASDRIAPTTSQKPPSNAETDVFEQPAISVDGAGVPAEQQAQQARELEEASRQIVTEAESGQTDSSVAQSIAPPTRPATSAPTPSPAPPPEVTEEPAESSNVQIAAAIAAALQNIAIAEPQPQPLSTSGLQLTRGEKEALTLAVSNCWNVGSLSTKALQTTVVVTVPMSEDARPVIAEIRLLSYSGGSEAAARQSFEAARRAIIRCGARGFNLPIEKFEYWRNIEMTFNPEFMSIR